MPARSGSLGRGDVVPLDRPDAETMSRALQMPISRPARFFAVLPNRPHSAIDEATIRLILTKVRVSRGHLSVG
jgi:hypothetical protein